MESYKYVIIGGGAAGTSAAEAIRGKDVDGTIAIISDEDHPLYSRVMLSKPNFFLGKIPLDAIWMKGKDWYDTNKINFVGGRTVTALDAEKKILTLDNSSQISYEKLLIATGVRTRPWNIPGSDKKGIYSLRTLEDGQAIMEAIKTAKEPKGAQGAKANTDGDTYARGNPRALTIGGGFIGFEMADLMHLAGLETTMLLREDYFWQPTLDEASGKMIEDALTKAGIKILKNAEVTEVVGGESVEGVVLKSGDKLDCDIIITGIGVIPPSLDFVKNAGIETKNAIIANEFLETNVSDIWTAGDIAEYKDLLMEENIQLGNWVNAREQGRVAGLGMTGERTPFKFVSFYTTQGVGVNIAFVGDSRPLPDRTIIKRGSPESGSYERILVDGKNELVGATMINRTGDMSAISKLIENNVNVSAHTSQLSDPNFDLKSLLGGNSLG